MAASTSWPRSGEPQAAREWSCPPPDKRRILSSPRGQRMPAIMLRSLAGNQFSPKPNEAAYQLLRFRRRRELQVQISDTTYQPSLAWVCLWFPHRGRVPHISLVLSTLNASIKQCGKIIQACHERERVAAYR